MYQSTAQQIENRVMARIAAFRQAERDCAPFMAELGSGGAFDSAEGLYRHVLTDACGLPKQDVQHLGADSLRVLLKHRPKPGSREWRDAPSLAFDSSGEKSVLDDILA